MLRARLFGGLAVWVDDRPMPRLSGLKPRALLAYLLLNPGPHPRARLAGRFSTGVDALLWQEARQPMHDARAISSVASRADGADGPAPGALDYGAALIVLSSLRLDIDRLEADLVDAIRDAGLDWEFIARTLHLSVPQAAKRQRLLSKRRASRPTAGSGRCSRPAVSGRSAPPMS
jgi:hypothetical protein